MAIDRLAPVGRALISVSDKSGLTELGHALAAGNVKILSTGGTASALAHAGLYVIDVARLTGFPEMLDGRVKTLHPKVHGGLLAFAATAGSGGDDHARYRDDRSAGRESVPVRGPCAGRVFDETVENIDIGGPTMLRSAAKNHRDVTVVVDPADYARRAR